MNLYQENSWMKAWYSLLLGAGSFIAYCSQNMRIYLAKFPRKKIKLMYVQGGKFLSSTAKHANTAAAITAVNRYAHFCHEILKSSPRKPPMVSVGSTWLVASHRITVAFPWQAFVLHPARKDKLDKVTVIISHGFMRAHRWIWLGWIGNQKSINGWSLFLPQIDFRFWQPLGNVLPDVMSLEMLKTGKNKFFILWLSLKYLKIPEVKHGNKSHLFHLVPTFFFFPFFSVLDIFSFYLFVKMH